MKAHKALNPFRILLIIGLCLFGSTKAQNTEQLFNTLTEEDTKAMEALVLYPEETRNAIFLASTQPEVLVRMDALADQTRSDLDAILERLDQKKQEAFWELVRFPELMSSIAAIDQPNKQELERLTKDLPEKVKIAVLDVGKNDVESIRKINSLNEAYNQTFNNLISGYATEVQDAYRLLINKPEVMEILTDNLRLTVLVGDNYLRDPEGIKQKSDSLQNIVAARNAKELDAWKKELDENPEAKEELKKAANDYAKDQGEEVYYNDRRNTVVVHHYPYWFGHPTWHPYHSWYPYNYYSNYGFYYDAFGNMVIIGLPSYHFSWWFFSHPNYYYAYPHFANHCFYHNHYYHHHHHDYYGMHTAISHWRSDNGNIQTEWLADKDKGPDRIRDLGRMEMSRVEYNKQNPSKEMSRVEYQKVNSEKYPNLRDMPVKKDPIQKIPISKEPRIVEPSVAPRPVAPARTEPIRRVPPAQDKQMDRAPDYHRKTWEKPKTPAPKTPVRKAPSQSKTQDKKNKENTRRK